MNSLVIPVSELCREQFTDQESYYGHCKFKIRIKQQR